MESKAFETEERPLHVCFFGTYRENYVRNQVLIHGLRSQGVTVHECHATLWHSVEDRMEQASGGWRNPKFWLRVLRAYLRLIRIHSQIPAYDIMLVGYPGQFDVFLGRLLTWLRRKPMVLDILMSLHLIAEERGLTKKSPFTGKLIFLLEKIGLKLPDLLIADTIEYREYYCLKYKLSSKRFRLIPLGVDDRIYYPRLHLKPPTDCFRVLYYGTFIPLHGIKTMIHAAALLQDHPNIRFDFYGDGQERSNAMALAKELKLKNVHFCGWIDKEKLPDEIAKSHVCLGVFGTTKQSLCTIQNKIWEGMMMQRPVITGDAETIRLELTNNQHILLVERANPRALADAILQLEAMPELAQKLVTNAYARVQNNRIRAIGENLKQILIEAISPKRDAA